MKRRKKKTERQKLIDQLDDIFRQIIRLRDNSICQKSGLRNNIEVAHYHSRKHLRLRWELDNSCCLNGGIHRYWAHVESEDFRDFWIKRIGQERFNELKLKKQYNAPVRTADLKLLKLDLLDKLEYYKRKFLSIRI